VSFCELAMNGRVTICDTSAEAFEIVRNQQRAQ
jgi:hypothetical protein